MKFRLRYAEQITGLFVLLAIFLVATALVLMGINKRWYIEDPHFFTHFNSAEGLSYGMNIRFKGFIVGRVDDMELLADNTVEVKFSIYKEYHDRVRENTVIEFATNPLNFGGGLLLHPGKYVTASLPSGSFIPSLDFTEGRNLVREGLVETKSADEISRLFRSAGEIMEEVKVTLDLVNTEVLPNINDLMVLAHAAASGNDSGPLGNTLGNVETITGEAAKMMEQVSQKSEIMLNDIQKLTRTISDPAALVNSLFSDDSSVAHLLNDDMALYRHIEEILVGINDSIAQVNSFARYINETTPQLTGLIEETRGALGESREVMEGLKNNPLLRGGIPEKMEQPTTFHGYRDGAF